LSKLVDRFFVSQAVLQTQPVVILTGEQAHQVRRVLRLRPGERVMLLDNLGSAYDAVLLGYDREDARFRIESKRRAGGEPATHLTLFQAALKGERFEWLLQKGTEIGVSRFVPLICERNVVDDRRAVDGKRERWLRIIQEATEQSRRARLPELAPSMRFADAVRSGAASTASESSASGGVPPAITTIRLIPWEGLRGDVDVGTSLQQARPLREALAGCNLRVGIRIEVFVGPEGGFAQAEIELARNHGILPVSLGPRILRAETAGVVAAATIMYEVGEI
jgi:16S rRNA (uracil1498-N3)-methyltransferase